MPTTARTNDPAFLSYIPIVDISESDQDTPAQLVDVASVYGFVYIKSTGLEFTSEIIDHAFASVRLLLVFPPGINSSYRW